MKTRLVRYLALNAALGMGIGWSIAAVGVLLNVAGLRDLASTTDVGILAALMVFFIFGTTFGSMQMGMAIMALAEGPGALPKWLVKLFQEMAASRLVGQDDIGQKHKAKAPALAEILQRGA